MGEAWTPVPGGLRLAVRLTPKAGRDEVTGLGDGPDAAVLKVRVRAVPEDGKANAALIETVADWLGLAKSSLALASGGKSRNKALLLNGDPEALAARIRARLAGPGNLPKR